KLRAQFRETADNQLNSPRSNWAERAREHIAKGPAPEGGERTLTLVKEGDAPANAMVKNTAPKSALDQAKANLAALDPPRFWHRFTDPERVAKYQAAEARVLNASQAPLAQRLDDIAKQSDANLARMRAENPPAA